MRTAWLNLVAFGSITSLIATACVVKTGDDDDDDETGGRLSRGGSVSTTGGRGGASGGRGGTGNGGASSGGVSPTGGTKSTGGAAATGGAGGTPPTPYCDGTGPASAAPSSCEYQDEDLEGDNGVCLACLTQSCCIAVRNCHGTDPSGEVIINQCGADGTEYLCYQQCLLDRAEANGGFYDPDMDPDVCAGGCARDGCGTIGDYTSELISCMHMKCETECFQP